MPELPEVESVRRRLEESLRGARIERIESLFPGVFSIPPGFPPPHLPARFESAERRGKMLILRFDRGQTLLVHLRMTGRFSFPEDRASLPPHTHVLIHLKGRGLLAYSDPRRFGRLLWYVAAPLEEIRELRALGPDALDIPRDRFVALLKCKRRTIKPLLLDQSLLAGLGNIYVDETLFRSGVHPLAAAHSLTRKKLGRVWDSMGAVLREAIDRGGSTIRDFVDSSGEAGGYQKLHQVYGRAGRPCKVCGATLKRLLVAQRGTVFCPECQGR